ncbi:uncharacterized protein Dwil_GK27488 [Drosophila willistoni]|uniref:Uncharacterized protein n=1 Tax=Drosophila willistoni TaxID=7260 RepID=A0A0Q9WZ65_DROWI|nr:uncharacterized protein LOC26529490 [Drosophila willistoni]KRF97464.1 uncharacterized protein Dwil_GK27488 [Drosophila willistoni]
MQSSKTTIALLLGCIVLLGPMMDVAHSLDLARAAKCAEVVAAGTAAYLSTAPPIIKKLVTCSGFKAAKPKVADQKELFLLIGDFLKAAIAKPNCVMSSLLETRNVLNKHVENFFNAKCFV